MTPRLAAEPKLAVVMGTEGDGLAADTIAHCDYTVMIPMSSRGGLPECGGSQRRGLLPVGADELPRMNIPQNIHSIIQAFANSRMNYLFSMQIWRFLAISPFFCSNSVLWLKDFLPKVL